MTAIDGQVVGRRIKALRIDRGYTQDELSDKSGVSSSQIARYERGESLPSFSAAYAIAKALDCSLDVLYARKDLVEAMGE